ncbi:MAG: site-specific integrase [Terriglobia bacterium]|jgi:integrase
MMRKPRDKKLPRGIFIRNGAYWIRYTDQNGKLHREKVGPFLEQAKGAVEKRRSEVRELKFFPEKIKQRVVLFAEIAKEYLSYFQKTARRDKVHIAQRVPVLLEVLKNEPVKEMTPGRLDVALADVAEKRGWSASTQNRYRSLLSGIFRHAVKKGNLEWNPIRETTHFKENNQRVRYLTDEEEGRLMAVVRSRWPERESEIVVALHSGMRRSEQYRTAQVPDGGLKWEHINFRANVIRLPRSKPGKAREIPMNSTLCETLRAIPMHIDSPYVFEGTDPAKWFGKALRAAKIENFHWHDLRHSFASRLAMAGVPMRHIAELMGHSEIQTTMRYAHLQPGHLAEAVERLVGAVNALESTGKVQNRLQTDTAISTSHSKRLPMVV